MSNSGICRCGYSSSTNQPTHLLGFLVGLVETRYFVWSALCRDYIQRGTILKILITFKQNLENSPYFYPLKFHGTFLITKLYLSSFAQFFWTARMSATNCISSLCFRAVPVCFCITTMSLLHISCGFRGLCLLAHSATTHQYLTKPNIIEGLLQVYRMRSRDDKGYNVKEQQTLTALKWVPSLLISCGYLVP